MTSNRLSLIIYFLIGAIILGGCLGSTPASKPQGASGDYSTTNAAVRFFEMVKKQKEGKKDKLPKKTHLKLEPPEAELEDVQVVIKYHGF